MICVSIDPGNRKHLLCTHTIMRFVFGFHPDSMACCCAVCCYTAVAVRHINTIFFYLGHTAEGSTLPKHTARGCCCYSVSWTSLSLNSCSCCRLQLLFVIVCRVVNFVPVVHCTWFQCFLSLHSNTISFQYTLWQYCRIFSYNTYHTSSVLRACAEPSRALDRRGGAPLIYIIYIVYVYIIHYIYCLLYTSPSPRD